MKLLAIAALVIPLGLGRVLPVPANNPITDEKVGTDRRGRPNPHLDPKMERLDLSDEDKRALAEFLRTSLNGRTP